MDDGDCEYNLGCLDAVIEELKEADELAGNMLELILFDFIDNNKKSIEILQKYHQDEDSDEYGDYSCEIRPTVRLQVKIDNSDDIRYAVLTLLTLKSKSGTNFFRNIMIWNESAVVGVLTIEAIYFILKEYINNNELD